MSGRRKDAIWNKFIEIKINNIKGNFATRAKCKKCSKVMVALVARMKTHVLNCEGKEKDSSVVINNEDIDSSDEIENASDAEISHSSSGLSQASGSVRASTSSKLDSFVVRTTLLTKEKLDLQIARFIFATNSPFRLVEHPEFLKMMQLLRPGYTTPNRMQISGELLNKVFDTVNSEFKNKLRGKTVCMALDGWSNIHNESIICICINDIFEDNVYLVDTIDTEDKSHTADYLLQLAEQSIKTCKSYGCNVRSFVTDNAANMFKMRADLTKSVENGVDIITYGCCAHILNLLSHDVEIPGIKEKIKKVVKYFRNNHFAAAKYKLEGGKSLVLPQDVRWNTLADCIESYLNNWHIIAKICTENRFVIDTSINSMVNDVNFKIKAQEYLKKMKMIAVALDKVQRDSCVIGEATEILLSLQNEFELELNDTDKHHCKKRLEMALTPAHFLANLLHHKFQGKNLNEDQIDIALDYVNTYYPAAMPDIINYRAKSLPFKEYLFIENTYEVKPITWWAALKSQINDVTMELTSQLHTASASSASIERLFRTFGLVHTQLRNRLGTEKASKLVTIFKHLNNNK